MTLQEFEVVFRDFVIAFNRDNSPERTKVYYDALCYYEALEVGQVLNDSIVGDEYFPTVSTLVDRIKRRRKVRVLECEYCAGSGWEMIYSAFEYAPGKDRAIRTGAPVRREVYESDPLKYHQFAIRCRCRPAEVKA